MTTKRWTRTCASAAVLSFALAGAAAAQSPTIAPATGEAPNSTPTTRDANAQVRATSGVAATEATASTGRSVDEIVVTAQKRRQSLQDVPIVVTAVGAQALQNAGVRDIRDLTVLTPGLMVTSTSNESVTTARIRGVGTVGDNPGLESSVGVVIDGVYRPRNGVSFGDLGEIERVEVLKGPQGTLFGKNTSAGVINVLSQQPSFKFGANGEFTVGNYGMVGGSASVTGPIIADKLAGRLYFAKRERDGYLDTITGGGPRTQTEDTDQSYYTIRGQLLWTPTSDLDFRFIGDFTKRDENCCTGVQLNNGPTTALVDAVDPVTTGVRRPADPFGRVSYSNRGTEQSIEDKGVSMEINYRTPILGGATLTSVTALRDWQTINGQDSDFSTADITYRPFDGTFGNQFKTFSQELRLAGKTEKLDWIAGLFYANEELDTTASFYYGTAYETYLGLLLSGGTNPTAVSAITGRPAGTNFLPGQGLLDRYNQTDDTVALFTNFNYRLTDKLELTGGFRYTWDSKDVNSVQTNTEGGVACAAAQARYALLPAATRAAVPTLCLTWENPAFNNRIASQTNSESAPSGTVKLAYRFNRQSLAYASYARGYKGSGFNLDRAQTPVATATSYQAVPDASTFFPGEYVDSYEIGSKNTLFNRSLLLNATAFYQEFSDFQLNTFLGTTFAVLSIPKVVSRGVDADFVYYPPMIEGLTLNGGVTYAETQYDDGRPNNAAFCTPGQTGGVCTGAAAGGALYRLPGSRLSLAPLWSSSLSATYERPVGNGLKARASANLKYTSDYGTGSDLNPLKVQTGFATVNARIGIGAEDNRWAVELFAQNLFDEGYYQVAFDAPLQTGTVNAFLGAPRTFGLTLRAKY